MTHLGTSREVDLERLLWRVSRNLDLAPSTMKLAAVEATREIGLAVTATTLSLVAIFAPVGFMSGMVGRFMQSFGLTMAFAVLVSLFVSFTLTPTMSAYWLKVPANGRGHSTSLHDRLFAPLDRGYHALLRWSMAHRLVIVGICALVVGSLVPLFKVSGVNFTPDEDESRFQITARLPPDASLAATQTLLDQIARDAREKLPGVTDTLCITGFGGGGGQPNAGIVFVRLAPIADIPTWNAITRTM